MLGVWTFLSLWFPTGSFGPYNKWIYGDKGEAAAGVVLLPVAG
ncbi:hypothetical protein SAMN05421771_1481 [Granulicella pectinivorans]|uniref:Uncharacterized protein n=1 Tax=Granulicella pectinivorans TaxID=474950 RepID=A0A1I6LYS5_9BACT|nr:hypothetical protein SAMN05421771_1481 [Granulicella pectinivorans]